MRFLGATAKLVRSRMSLTQDDMASQLGISVVHLSNIENCKAMPSSQLIEKYHEVSGVDLYVMDWCNNADASELPVDVQNAAKKLQKFWELELER